MLKRLSGGQELGELVSTACNTYANAGSVAQFDFHQSDKSKESFPLLSFLSSNDLMESARAWYFMNSVFITSICARISGCSYNLNIYNPMMSDKVTGLIIKGLDNQAFHHVFPNFSNSADDSLDQTVDRIKIVFPFSPSTTHHPDFHGQASKTGNG
jgi:hypothetical protein